MDGQDENNMPTRRKDRDTLVRPHRTSTPKCHLKFIRGFLVGPKYFTRGDVCAGQYGADFRRRWSDGQVSATTLEPRDDCQLDGAANWWVSGEYGAGGRTAKSQQHQENRARKSLRTITLILGAFVLCWTPWSTGARPEKNGSANWRRVQDAKPPVM